MRLSRRHVLTIGGGGLASLGAPAILRAGQIEEIAMEGTARGERVWFAPFGLAVAPGTTVRFVNRDRGNSHTATAYHPDNYDRQRRIPDAAAAWDSDFLLPGEAFETTLEAPGVYDYYCLPHEMAGMVGRIVVGSPSDAGWQGAAPPSDDLDPPVLAAFPDVEAVLSAGRLMPADAA